MFLTWLIFYLALRFITNDYLNSVESEFLHNGGNDAYWETWVTLRTVEHELAQTNVAGMLLDLVKVSFC